MSPYYSKVRARTHTLEGNCQEIFKLLNLNEKIDRLSIGRNNCVPCRAFSSGAGDAFCVLRTNERTISGRVAGEWTPRASHAQVLCDGSDVFGCGAATAADDPGPGVHPARGVLRELLR
jgi:hypothetical protein